MRQRQMNVGSADKISVWTYNIQLDRLAAHVGRNIDRELEALREGKG